MYNTKTFSQIFPTFASMKKVFDEDFDMYAKDCITANSLKALYWLLFARYGENPIASLSENIFKAQLVSNTFQKGPTWERKLALQKSLRDLTEAELLVGAKTIFNTAEHPETEPGTDTDTELTYINAQDVSKQRRSKLDAYSYLQDILKTDITEDFIRSYSKLFSKFVSPTVEWIYENEEVDIQEDEEEEQP